MELELESELSGGPALEKHDTTALTKEQQDRLNQHKVGILNWHSIMGCTFLTLDCESPGK